MARKLKPDWALFLVTLALVVFGVVMVFSSSAVIAKERFGDPNYFSFKQLLAAALGFAVLFMERSINSMPTARSCSPIRCLFQAFPFWTDFVPANPIGTRRARRCTARCSTS